MKTLNYTPGDWVAGCDLETDDNPNAIFASGVIVARVEDSPEIRQRHNKGKVEGPGCTAGPDALDEVDDNARLMAMAPKLYRIALEFVNAFAGNKAAQLGNGEAYKAYAAFRKLLEIE